MKTFEVCAKQRPTSRAEFMETYEANEHKRTFEAHGYEKTRKVRTPIADHQGTRSGWGLYAHGAKGDSQG